GAERRCEVSFVRVDRLQPEPGQRLVVLDVRSHLVHVLEQHLARLLRFAAVDQREPQVCSVVHQLLGERAGLERSDEGGVVHPGILYGCERDRSKGGVPATFTSPSVTFTSTSTFT